jgi:hypothetical protein
MVSLEQIIISCDSYHISRDQLVDLEISNFSDKYYWIDLSRYSSLALKIL